MIAPVKNLQHKGGMSSLGMFLTFCAILAVLLAVAVPSISVGSRQAKENAWYTKIHNLAIAAFNYSTDHRQVYPLGASSTEIFQTLYDEKYLLQGGDLIISDKGGKTIASGDPSVKLKPENVSFDFVTRDTTGLEGDDPSNLPLLFSEEQTAPNWVSGVNNATITSSDPWGIDGVTICNLDLQTSFVRPNPVSGQVCLTTTDFAPALGLK